MVTAAATPDPDEGLSPAHPPSRTGPNWLRTGLSKGERKWVTSLRIELEKAGYGDRRTCEYRARRCLFYRRLVQHELDSIAHFGVADYERGFAFLEETARIASGRPEPGTPGVHDPLA